MAAIERVGVEGWTELVTSNFIALSVTDVADDFRGSLVRCDLSRGITLTEVRTEPSRVRRTARLVGTDGLDDVLFLVHQDGIATSDQNDHRLHLTPGLGSLHTATCPYELNFASSSRVVVLQVPRRLLPASEHLPPARPHTGFAAEDPAMRVFSAFAREVIAVAEELGDRTREEMGATALDLLLSVLHGGIDAPNSSELGPDALVRTMESFVRAHLDDPDLTPASIARHHHVSLRYVQTLFAATGTTPAAFIRTERLNRALHFLRDPRYARLPVAAVGHRVGIRNTDTFIRAFRREFGMTPGDWRTAATTPPDDWWCETAPEEPQ